MSLAPEAQGLKRNRPATGERVQHLRRLASSVGVQQLVGGGNQRASRFDVVLLVRVLPPDQMLDELKATIARRVLDRLAVGLTVGPEPLVLQQVHHELAKVFRALRIVRIGDQRSEHHRPARRQRSPRPPDVQRRDVPVPDRLLPSRLLGDLFQRQGNFDQAFQHFAVSVWLRPGNVTGWRAIAKS